ncbi:MAG: ROK family protein [Bifidobacterium sp.]|jgi:glucokinase|nr:ROK family protein [Bifidobacterium sp.]
MEQQYYLGIDVGGTFIKYGIVDDNYTLVRQWKKKSIRFEKDDDYFDYLCDAPVDRDTPIRAYGLSVPGLVGRDAIIRTKAAASVGNLFGHDVNHEVSGRTGLPSATINDAKAAGLCELKLGNAKGTNTSACMIIGTGVGGCLCSADDVVYGADGFAGEIHFIPYFEASTGKILKLGNQCSMRALVRFYNNLASHNSRAALGSDVIMRYRSGDGIAAQAVDMWMTHLVMDVITMVVNWNPDVICIGGGISEERWFIDLLTARYRTISVPFFNATEEFLSTRIVKCRYNNSSNLLGAVLKARMEHGV